eukprot:5628125-Pleurochrysis_carterae.AAC.1
MRARVVWERRRVCPVYAVQGQGGANAWGARSEPGGQQYHWRQQWAADMRRPLPPVSVPALQLSRQRKVPPPRTPAG